MVKERGSEMNIEQASLQRTQIRKVEVTVVFDQNYRAIESVIANIGGSRSSKSYSLAQLMVKKFVNEKNKSFLTTRKTLPSLRQTAYKVAVDMMKDYGYYPYFEHNKSERTVFNPFNGNLWLFTSIDNPEKIKSTEYNYIHMEEANEFTYDDYMILKLRMSGKEGPGERNQIFLSLNPSEKYGWVNKDLLQQPEVRVIHSTYKDAIQYLPESYVKRLEALEGEDESYWQIYGLGEFADIAGQIYKIEIWRGEYPECKETIYGMDFGFQNPNVLLQVDIDMERMALYITELLYQSGMTNADLKARLKVLIPPERRQREIYADSAEPARIEEIYQEDFNIMASDKSVADGIDCVKRFKIYTREENINFNREMSSYKRKVDRAGNVLEEPVKFNDHCPDALRYPVFTHLRERLVAFPQSWVQHVGIEEKEAKEKAAKAPVQTKKEEAGPEPRTIEERNALRARLRNEGKAAEGEALSPFQGKPKKEVVKEAPKEEPSEDDSWVI